MKKKLIAFSVLALLLFSTISVFAAHDDSGKIFSNSVNGGSLYKYNANEVNMIKNNFQNRYQNRFNFSNSVVEYYEVGERIKVRVMEQKKFLFFNVNTIEEYDLEDTGAVNGHEYNFWAKLLNRNRWKVE